MILFISGYLFFGLGILLMVAWKKSLKVAGALPREADIVDEQYHSGKYITTVKFINDANQEIEQTFITKTSVKRIRKIFNNIKTCDSTIIYQDGNEVRIPERKSIFLYLSCACFVLSMILLAFSA